MPRVECGSWPDWLVGGWLVPSVGLLVLYWIVAAVVFRLWLQSRGTAYPYHRLPWIAAFFVGCGGGHLMNALAFVWPQYVAFCLWEWYTLGTSLVGTVGVVHLVRWSRGRIADLTAERNVEAEAAAQERTARLRAEAERDEEHRKREAAAERRERQIDRQRVELDAMRDDLERTAKERLTDEDYRRLRKRLHDIQGAAR